MEDAVLQLRSIKSNVKPLALPIFVICAVIVVLLVTAPIIYGNISDGFERINQANSSKTQLESKIASLKDIQTNILPSSSNTVLAIPDKNPMLYKWNVIRGAIDQIDTVSVEEFSTNSQRQASDSEYNNMEIKAKLIGAENMDQILQIIDGASSTIPLTTISDFIYASDQGENSYEIGFQVYWSDLPTKITTLTEPVNELTTQELQTLNFISSLRVPEFAQVDRTSYPDRVNPFQ